MGELSARLMVTGGNVTGIVDQLEGEGLSCVRIIATDRRAFRMRSPPGRRQFRRMAAVHEAWIVELLRRPGAPRRRTGRELACSPRQRAHLAPAARRTRPAR